MKKLLMIAILCVMLLMSSCALSNILGGKDEPKDPSQEVTDPADDILLLEPDYSQMTDDEIKAYFTGDMSEALERADARYLSDAVFYEEGVHYTEEIIPGIDLSDWKKPGLYHPDFSALLEEYEDEEEPTDEPLTDGPFISSDSLPERFAKLIPDTVLAQADIILVESEYMIYCSTGESEYHAIVDAAKKAGYTAIQELTYDGMLMYYADGANGDTVMVSYSDGEISVLFSAR